MVGEKVDPNDRVSARHRCLNCEAVIEILRTDGTEETGGGDASA